MLADGGFGLVDDRPACGQRGIVAEALRIEQRKEAGGLDRCRVGIVLRRHLVEELQREAFHLAVLALGLRHDGLALDRLQALRTGRGIGHPVHFVLEGSGELGGLLRLRLIAPHQIEHAEAEKEGANDDEGDDAQDLAGGCGWRTHGWFS